MCCLNNLPFCWLPTRCRSDLRQLNLYQRFAPVLPVRMGPPGLWFAGEIQWYCVLVWGFYELLAITAEADDQTFPVIEETSAN